ncbi:transporter [Rhodoblastus sp.]|uniref:transporter n=1 Tax=Rhodoblastus sp. TaxID=1962975 RepID=UPI003F9CAFFA
MMVLCAIAATPRALAQQLTSDRYYELETKYLFGFTDGTDIGAEGEKEVEAETTAGLGMHDGTYRAIEQEFEFENVPSQYWGYEASAHFLSQQINDVDGLRNLNQTTFSGLSWKPKFLIIGRGPGNPIGLSISVQPEWGRIDGTSGISATSFSMETRIAADTELIENMLYAATNLIYAPEVERAPGDPTWSRSSGFGATAAAAYRVAPKVTLGGEAEYYRAYGGFGFDSLDGSAFYLGPTLHIQFNPKIYLAAAWSFQVVGHAQGQLGNLDLTDFTRQRGNLKLGFEF